MVALNSGLAEQIDRIRVGSGRVGTHTRVWFQAFASTHQEHLVRRDHAAFSLDRFLQLGDTAQKNNRKVILKNYGDCKPRNYSLIRECVKKE